MVSADGRGPWVRFLAVEAGSDNWPLKRCWPRSPVASAPSHECTRRRYAPLQAALLVVRAMQHSNVCLDGERPPSVDTAQPQH